MNACHRMVYPECATDVALWPNKEMNTGNLAKNADHWPPFKSQFVSEWNLGHRYGEVPIFRFVCWVSASDAPISLSFEIVSLTRSTIKLLKTLRCYSEHLFPINDVTLSNMISDLIREAPFGQLLRYITDNRVLQYPEEKADFRCPDKYVRMERLHPEISSEKLQRSTSTASSQDSALNQDSLRNGIQPALAEDSNWDRIDTLPHNQEGPEVEVVLDWHKTRSHSKVTGPMNTEDGILLVDWYTTDDPENPQNCTTTFRRHYLNTDTSQGHTQRRDGLFSWFSPTPSSSMRVLASKCRAPNWSCNALVLDTLKSV